MKPSPPHNARRFLRWFCREDYIEEIEGDLTEVFEKQYEASPAKAQWKFAWSVIRYFRPEFIKSFKTNHILNFSAMFQSYFKIGWRNLLKNKSYSIINIIGLSLSIACCLLIFLVVRYELSFDTYRVCGRNDARGENIWSHDL